ncbi:MAG: hypothetical protein QOC64_2995, partial [Solirubrobacteraceae bacterium]|nr:hypothetical protein [Solirubrobacteraceae bacterium]
YLEAKARGRRGAAGELAGLHDRARGAAHRRAGDGARAGGRGPERGDVTRDDVAATIVAVLDEPRTVGRTFDLVQGDTPIVPAVARL